MDKTSVIGFILGIVAVGVGMVIKGVSMSALINPAAILIIIAGTIGAVLIAFPTKTIMKVPSLFKIIFTEKNDMDMYELIENFSTWAEQSRREGLLSLESTMDEIEDPFLNSGLQTAKDCATRDFMRDVFLEKIDAMQERHEEGGVLFSRAVAYAPGLVVLGCVVRLIAACGSMEIMDVRG